MDKFTMGLIAVGFLSLGWGIGLIFGIEMGKYVCPVPEVNNTSEQQEVVTKVMLYYDIDDPTTIYTYDNDTIPPPRRIK